MGSLSLTLGRRMLWEGSIEGSWRRKGGAGSGSKVLFIFLQRRLGAKELFIFLQHASPFLRGGPVESERARAGAPRREKKKRGKAKLAYVDVVWSSQSLGQSKCDWACVRVCALRETGGRGGGSPFLFVCLQAAKTSETEMRDAAIDGRSTAGRARSSFARGFRPATRQRGERNGGDRCRVRESTRARLSCFHTGEWTQARV